MAMRCEGPERLKIPDVDGDNNDVSAFEIQTCDFDFAHGGLNQPDGPTGGLPGLAPGLFFKTMVGANVF
ncbi:hypothetical protein COLO4_06659 [Corchorus olitorius]|uniref:Uncharacterized protein n=1 Tax=Corchorus olitorius TaxID=93759 RepID=A0A1R3KMA7_9ROSI|nr:hypothetical protein COLO4_06659 [Corchorus olitorius]